MGCGVLQRTSSHSTWAATQSRLMSPWSLSHVTLAHVVILLVWRLDLHFIEVFWKRIFPHSCVILQCQLRFPISYFLCLSTPTPPSRLPYSFAVFYSEHNGVLSYHCFELVLVRNLFVCLYLLFLTVVFATLSKVSWHQVASDIVCLIIQFAWWRIEFLLENGIGCPLDSPERFYSKLIVHISRKRVSLYSLWKTLKPVLRYNTPRPALPVSTLAHSRRLGRVPSHQLTCFNIETRMDRPKLFLLVSVTVLLVGWFVWVFFLSFWSFFRSSENSQQYQFFRNVAQRWLWRVWNLVWLFSQHSVLTLSVD